ncbi:MAG: hypothetical protein LBL46_02570 [Rickettsiales bacterium]|jgi:hypothetical protein|nr:hypothetical protein [Rickettsiales bacterium]
MRKLFAGIALVLSAQGAESAKMCRLDNSGMTYAYNASAKIWANGIGCGDTEKSGGADQLCATRKMSGVGWCAEKGYTTYGPANENEVGKYCHCRMTWPIEGRWILGWYTGGNNDPFTDAAACAAKCAMACGADSRSNLFLFMVAV